ncbi:DUF6567 family protein [Gracilimonas sp.]|uniref:DUF6567 family protein n=1 Tax=Gracilimonas sp. TaxID=1974203 RepID=UPI0032EF574F
MKSYTFIILMAVAFLLTGCGNAGMFVASNSTEVQLKEGNYTIVAKNVTGTSETSYLFGASYSWGVATNSVGIIPLDGNKMLYKEARESLWDNFEEQGESIEGRTLALINIQYDSNTSNFMVYTKASVSITADIIEFE